jgi:hypothetical protein
MRNLRCPYCKRLDQLIRDCLACNGTGNVSRETYDNAPKELKAGLDDEAVYINCVLTKTFLVK